MCTYCMRKGKGNLNFFLQQGSIYRGAMQCLYLYLYLEWCSLIRGRFFFRSLNEIRTLSLSPWLNFATGCQDGVRPLALTVP